MILATAALFILAQSSSTVSVLGMGNRTCGAWTTAAAAQTVDAALERREFTGWLMGYLSGLNSTKELGGIAVAADGQGYRAWMDDYCARHPLDTVYVAAASLVNELIRRENT